MRKSVVVDLWTTVYKAVCFNEGGSALHALLNAFNTSLSNNTSFSKENKKKKSIKTT